MNMTVFAALIGTVLFGAASTRWGVDSRVDDGRRNL